MTNNDVLGVLIDLVGANIFSHKIIADLIAKLPQHEREEYAKALEQALKANQEAFEKIKKAMAANG
jgi:DNA polymerase II small subunit/DNA polymerase delta subunit B